MNLGIASNHPEGGEPDGDFPDELPNTHAGKK
jgi:hypothetical protein